jgi:hypothetical protein
MKDWWTDTPEGRWTMAGNTHLLTHIRRHIAKRSRRYGTPASFIAMRASTREESPNADASPEFIANVGRLVAAKNAWVTDMLDLAQKTGEVPVELQRTIWKDYLQRAEAEIAASIRASSSSEPVSPPK